MKRRNLCVSKKLLAVILAASMSMNSGMIAMAADGGSIGTAVLDNNVVGSDSNNGNDQQSQSKTVNESAPKEGKDVTETYDRDATSDSSDPAVSVRSYEGYSANVTVEGTATATNKEVEATGVSASSTGKQDSSSSDNNSNSSTSVTVTEEISASSGSSSATGIEASSYGGGSTEVTAKENVSASSESGSATGITARSSDNGSATNVNIEKDLTVSGQSATGMTAYADSMDDSNQSVNVTVGGNVSVTGGKFATGIEASAGGKGTVNIEIGKDFTVASDGKYGTGIGAYAQQDNSSVTVKIGNDVNVSGNRAINAMGHGDVDVLVGGNVIQKGDGGVAAHLSDGEGSESKATITVTVAKDITATGDAVTIQKTSDDSTIDLLVEGTISGGDHAVVLKEVEKKTNSGITKSQSSTENLNITVWKIESNKDGNLVEDVKTTVSNDTNNMDSSKSTTYTRNEEAEKNINYIIKVDPIDPSIGGKFALSGTTLSHGFETAHEGEKVYLEVTVPDNYEIESFYNAKGAANVSVISSGGKYYLEVPRGGGVYVGVNLKKIENSTPVTPTYSSSGYSSDYSDSDSDDHGFTVGNNNDSSVIGTTLPPEFVAFQIHATTFAGLDAAQNLSDVLTLIEPLLAFNIFVEAGIPTQGVQNVIGAGIVNFNNMFVDAITETVEVPVSANVKENQAYTVVFSDGTSIVVNCVMDGVLVIPFDKKAAGLTYMIYGTQLDPSAFIGTATADLTQ
ncbi:MAG: hypothetical protein E7232_07085 [Lachnospiraceae bacterium]|nr:hypothetical protein [Lachnospiraceae bacterium]